MPKALIKADGYAALFNKVRRTLIEGQRRIEQERVRTYLETGQIIRTDILKHKNRAGYGEQVILLLAKDLNVDRTLLNRCVRFAEVYPRLPIGATWHQFSWSHYRELMTISDDKKRSQLEKMALQNDWSVQELASRIKKDSDKSLDSARGKPVPQLTFTRGKLHTYQIVPANKSLIHRGPLALDLGFREQYEIPGGAPRLKENDTVELVFSTGGACLTVRQGSATHGGGKDGTLIGVRKVSVTPEDLFTYVAMVEKVIDGDTLLVSFDFGCPMSVSWKLRLREIDCPEIDTEEGRRAKRFVESRLKGCDFIIVKTYKDRSDKFDRYLADVFYAPKGIYLNQELLNEHLAVRYEF